MSVFSFNPQIATKYGVEGAIFIQNLFFWIEKNAANRRHFYDGNYWTYNSTAAFAELFPFWTARQIERIIKNLESDGAIRIGNFNPVAYDRTRWFSLHETVISIYANGEMDLRKWLNGFTQTVKPIPDNKTQIVNTDIKNNAHNVHFENFWRIYDKKIDRKSCEKIWAKINPDDDMAAKIIYAASEYVKTITDKQFQKHPKTWLNNESWNNDLIISNGVTQNVTKHQITTSAANAIINAAKSSLESRCGETRDRLVILPDGFDLRSSVVAEFPIA